MKFLVLSAFLAVSQAGVLISTAPAHHFQAATAPAAAYTTLTLPLLLLTPGLLWLLLLHTPPLPWLLQLDTPTLTLLHMLPPTQWLLLPMVVCLLPFLELLSSTKRGTQLYHSSLERTK